MLLQKLRGAHCCLLDVAPYPLGELGGLKVSRSGVDSGIGESVAAGSLSHSATAPPAERPQSPGPKNHSTTLHNLVQLCLQQQPERRLLNNQSLLVFFLQHSFPYISLCVHGCMHIFLVLIIHRPSASTLLTHAFFKQVGQPLLLAHIMCTIRLKAMLLFSLICETNFASNICVHIVAFHHIFITDHSKCAAAPVFEWCFIVLWQVKRHTTDSFLSLLYPALPLTVPKDPPISSPPAPSCHPPSPTAAEVMWDFS